MYRFLQWKACHRQKTNLKENMEMVVGGRVADVSKVSRLWDEKSCETIN